MRAVDTNEPYVANVPTIPNRNYKSNEVLPVELDTPYTSEIEIWPTQVVVSKGSMLVLDISSCDTEGSGLFTHTHPEDRNIDKLKGWNTIHFGPEYDNFLTLPVIPQYQD
jgi:hypothetical protein